MLCSSGDPELLPDPLYWWNWESALCAHKVRPVIQSLSISKKECRVYRFSSVMSPDAQFYPQNISKLGNQILLLRPTELANTVFCNKNHKKSSTFACIAFIT